MFLRRVVVLSPDKRIQAAFTNEVAPLASSTVATQARVDPWCNLKVDQVQAIVDDVYGAGVFEVKEEGPWLGLVRPLLSYRTHY